MVERIRALLQARQLSPTQFADAIGVARPIISHILSGRNKPSLEVVQKIIAAFPDLSLPWLLNGQGPMLPSSGPTVALPGLKDTPAARTTTAEAESPIKHVRATVTTAAAPPEPLPAATLASSSVSIGSATPPAGNSPSLAADPPMVQPGPAEAASVRQPIASSQPLANPVAAFVEPGKKIKRIVIFYHDGTFGDFIPE